MIDYTEEKDLDLDLEQRPETLAVRTLRRFRPDGSLTSFAEECDVSTSMVSLVLSGKRDPSLGKAKVMAKRLGISLDEFCQVLDGVESKGELELAIA